MSSPYVTRPGFGYNPPPSMNRWKATIAAVALGVAGMLAAFHPTLFSGFTQMQSDPGDTRLINHTLEIEHRAVFGDESLRHPAFFFPARHVAGFTDVLLGVLPFYSPLRLCGVAPDTAFQWWVLLMSALNYVVGLWLLRRGLGLSLLASAFGAFLFAFGSPRLNQLNHLQMVPWFYVALSCGALAKLLRGGDARWVWLFFVGIAAQLYTAIYSGWFFGFGLGVALVVALVHRPSRAAVVSMVRARSLVWLAGIIVCAVAIAPLGSIYLSAAKEIGALRTFAEAEAMVPRLQSWLDMGDRNLVYGWANGFGVFTQLPMEWEHRLGLGPLTTALVVFAAWRHRATPWVRVLGLSMLTVLALATMYRFRVTPWQLVFHLVPGANALRAVARIGLLLLVPASMLLALQIDRARRPWLALVLAGLALVEQLHRPAAFDKQRERDRVAELAKAIAPSCRSFFFAASGETQSREQSQLTAMWARLQTGVPTVNGYSGATPPGWALEEDVIRSPEDRARLEAALASWAERNHLDPPPCFVTLP